MNLRTSRVGKLGLALFVLGVGTVQATETRRWIVDTADDFLEGRGDGVAVSEDGRLVVVPRWRSAASLEEPVVMAAARAADGALLVGTGYPARLYRSDGRKMELLSELDGEQVTALAIEAGGGVLVATVSPGVLYRWRSSGGVEEVGRLGDGGIWDLVQFGETVIAAAGPPASLYRVGPRGLERWAELPDVHARCLATGAGMLFVGTSGKGLVLGVRAAGQVALLADSPFTEISDLLWTPDGSVWAVALVGEPVKRAPVGGKDEAEPTTVELDLPKIDGATATSEVLRLTPEGALLKVHRFAKQVAVALAWDGEGVLVGTGFEGELWRFLPGGGARLASVDAVQVTAIVDGGSALLTQGPGGVLLRDGGPDRDARFRIDAKRFERPVRFGELRIVPANPEVRIRFRSGIAEKPDETWLPWSAWVSAEGGVVPLPPATSLQWELDLPRREQATSVERVEVAYREVNLPPRLESVEVEDPGVVYLSAPPPSGPVIDVAHPDFSGVFTVIDEKGGGNSKPKQGKKYWRVGFRTVNWKAEDPNGDPMRFQLELEHPDGFRLPVRERLETTQVALDTTAVPDGWYRFWIQASDEHGNPEQPLEATAYSRWFTVDNTPPEVQLRRQGDDWMVTVSDALSSLSRVEWARDGERWHGLAPEDGVLDGRAESFHFGAASGNHMVVVRAIDRQHNRVVTGVVEE